MQAYRIILKVLSMNTTSEWFKDWFNTRYYHQLYSNRNYEEAENFISKLLICLNLNKEQKILDLACGKGRHSIFLNSKGFDVVGVDLSENSIKTANLQKRNGLEFFVQDMRAFNLKRKFSVVLNLFTSFGYFDNQNDNEKVIARVKEHLEENGLFVIDFLNSEYVKSGLVDAEEKNIGNTTYRITREVTAGFVKKHIQVIDGDYNQTFHEQVQLFSKEEIESMLTKQGFTITNVFGNYKLEDYDASNSERLIIIAKKNS